MLPKQMKLHSTAAVLSQPRCRPLLPPRQFAESSITVRVARPHSIVRGRYHAPSPRLVASRASQQDISSSSLGQLQDALAKAVAAEDYETAASLRDQLEKLQRVSSLAVEEANAAFYRAFQFSDFKAMQEIWGHGEHVQCIHPASGCVAGREEVIESWEAVLQSVSFDILLRDVRVHATDTMGFVTCVEIMEGDDSRGRLVATNVFEKQDGKWKMVQHHASSAPRPR